MLIEKSITAAKKLSQSIGKLKFSQPVTHVYNPLKYAWAAHEQYLRMMNPRGTKVLFLGMNPGPWGMAQTGVPFGQIAAVRDWLKIDALIKRPKDEHPKRQVEGLQCRRNEVSGDRLWGLFRHQFKTPIKFFKDHFVTNYCPLVFMEESGRNRTPDKLPAEERQRLNKICDIHLVALIEAIKPKWAVGVGAYAEKCLIRVATKIQTGQDLQIEKILHPSPASPAANRGWAEQATCQMQLAGIWKR